MAQPTRKRQPREAPVQQVVRPDWLVLGLAAAGVLVTAYLTMLKLTGSGAAFCVAGSGCDIVQASRYALFLGVPTALWGGLAYVALAVLAWMGLSRRNWLIAFVIAAGGVGFSIYMTALSVFELRATCVWCVTSGVILVAVFAVLLLRRPAPTGRGAALGPVRLVSYAVLSAAAAVVAGAFVFAMPSAAPPGYASALARHLSESRAMMYGAFW